MAINISLYFNHILTIIVNCLNIYLSFLFNILHLFSIRFSTVSKISPFFILFISSYLIGSINSIVIVPGYFINCFFLHSLPEFKATGTKSTPSSFAKTTKPIRDSNYILLSTDFQFGYR